MSTKRAAPSPVASPSKAAAFNAKRSRTQYNYCDEEDVESYPEDQWSSEEVGSHSTMSLDGSDDTVDRFMLGFGAGPSNDFLPPKYDKDRKVTEVGH